MKHDIFQEAARAALEARFARLTPETPRLWGRMDAHQMVVHCADALRTALGLRPAKMRHTFATRTFVKPLIVNGWLKAPKGKIKTFPEIAQEMGGTKPAQFEEDRKDLLSLLDRMATDGKDAKLADHPNFGPLTAREWGRLTLIHLDHHLQQFGL